ncbi:glycosyltransferase 87 family protein [uncultured Jatrophihabitans sp.]|uniref:glycosyltransferase 87 family protein n=1 Tax=uncultured Jatrophihabitans sp. TaxID=1610747 RepID=UPI0035C9438F
MSLVAVARPTRRSGASRPGRAFPLVTVVAALTVLAVALRLFRLNYGYAHPVAEYDGGVYLSSALAFVDGRLPYRDYVFVQPPGIVLLLSPVALLAKAAGTAQAMGLAKILVGLVGAAAVPVGALVLRHRGPAATTLGCAVLALQGDAIASAWTPLLEPWLVLCCLGAAALAFTGDELAGSRRLLFAGVLLGLACSIKIWAVAPAVVLVVVALAARRGRAPLAGLLLGAGVPLLPFALASPGAFWHQVVVAQVTRSAPTRTPTAFRLVHMFATSTPNGEQPDPLEWALLVTVALLVLVLLVVPWLRRPPRSPLEWFAVGAAVLVVAMLLTPDTFYWHYATFSTPFLVLAGALRLPPRWGRRPAVAVASVAVLVLAVLVVPRSVRSTHPYDNHRALQAAIPKGACVVSSTPGATIAADRVSTRGSCPPLFDPFGQILAATGGQAPSEAQLRRPAVIRLWLAAYRRADFVYLQPRATPQFPTDGPAQAYLDRNFRRLPLTGPGQLYERVGPDAGSA